MEIPNSLLRGIQLPNPNYSLGALPDDLNNVKYYSNIQTYFPSLKTLFGVQDVSSEIWFDNNMKVTNIQIVNEENIKGNCKIKVNNKVLNAYLKVTHLIDPVSYIKKKNDECDINNDVELQTKINDPWNQAYVEALATYALGKLAQEKVSPHFNIFYGAFRAVAKKYCYNISDEVDSYRLYKWFWNGIEQNYMTVSIDGVDSNEEAKEIYDEIMKKPDYCLDNNETSEDFEELKETELNTTNDELHSCSDSLSIKTYESEHESDSSDYSDEDDIKVLINLPDFPVMMIIMEKNESTMDDLLEEYNEETKDKKFYEKWSAWLFQVIASLCVAQTLFGFVHNDLHSNNIVWEDTEELYIYYKTNDNKYFKVPTYGKVFKIIDFGRSIFSINQHLFVSDDFKEGNDAATQYNFPELNGENSDKKVYPNPSFDLARLAISIFESLFPETPSERKDGTVLSSEEGRLVKESENDLYNIVWSWLIDSEGRNILWDSDNDERFPDFELYTHIAEYCFNSVPKEQIYKKPFSKFIVNSVSKGQKVYQLFV